ncbi:4-oxalocrotonate tautomerase family protein [Kribbella sp. NBC_00662]
MEWAQNPTEKGNQMPIVTVLQGPRTPELKRELVQKVTDAFVDSLGVPAESVQVWIQETPPDSWAIGGTLTADK